VELHHLTEHLPAKSRVYFVTNPKRWSGRAVRTPGPVVRSPIIKNGLQAAVASMTVAIGVFVSMVVARRSPAAAKSWLYSVSLRSRPPKHHHHTHVHQWRRARLADVAKHLFDHGHPAARQHGASAVLQDADIGRVVPVV
jgi:hypothetical protein